MSELSDPPIISQGLVDDDAVASEAKGSDSDLDELLSLDENNIGEVEEED